MSDPLEALQKALKADPDGAYIFSADITVEEARAFGTEGEITENLDQVFDEAQAPVFSDETPESFIVIRIKK